MEAKRDSYVDGWRGIFHIILVADHLPFLFPGLFPHIAGIWEWFGFFSVAEGFVFLSGYVSGLVYFRLKQERGGGFIWKKALWRALQIYLCYTIAVIGLVLLVKQFGKAGISWGSWNALLNAPVHIATARTLALTCQPMFLEILPMYCLLIAAMPALLLQISRGRQVLVVSASFAVWLASQFGVRDSLLALWGIGGVVQTGFFDLMGWQILFVCGLVCGCRTYMVKGSWLPNAPALLVGTVVISVALFCQRHGLLNLSVDGWCVDRATVGPLRLLNFLCVAFLLSKARSWIVGAIAWSGFAFLSRHSLQVFAFHLYPIYLISLAGDGNRWATGWWGMLFAGLCVAALYYIAFASQTVRQWWNAFCKDRRILGQTCTR